MPHRANKFVTLWQMSVSIRNIELLAPAKDYLSAVDAIDCGADAVYIGAGRFGARYAATNSVEDIAKVVDYAHRFGVKVYATLNTIIFDSEIEDAKSQAEALVAVGVDALIIQDLKLLDYGLPPIRMHASTQCDNRTSEQILHLQQLGFRRAVLARELSLEQITEIHQTTQHYTILHNTTPCYTILNDISFGCLPSS